MTRKELEDLAAAALLEERDDNYVSQTVAQMYENAITVIDTVMPLITEAIAAQFDAKARRLDMVASKSGYALGAEVTRERVLTEDAARVIRAWRPAGD